MADKRFDMRSFWREHAVALTVSIFLHVLLAAAIVYSWWHWHTRPKPIEPMPIQATVVDEAAIKRETAKLEAAEQQQKEAERAAEEHAAEVKRQAEEEAKKLEELKQQREAAEQAAAAEAAAKAKAQADASKQAAVQKKKSQEAKLRAEREAELKRQLEAEEKRQAAVSSGELANYIAQIQARIQHAWNRPPSAAAGLDCTVYITQVPGGTIAAARLGECNGDDAVRESILAAVYRASPLPAPSNPELFDRNLKVPFRPDQ